MFSESLGRRPLESLGRRPLWMAIDSMNPLIIGGRHNRRNGVLTLAGFHAGFLLKVGGMSSRLRGGSRYIGIGSLYNGEPQRPYSL